MEKTKRWEHFNLSLVVIFVSIGISLFAFMTANSNPTGYAAANSKNTFESSNLLEFKDVKSMITLPVGRYYIDNDGIVYWLDDSSRPAVAKVNNIPDGQKNKEVYVDNNGNVGFIIS